jgi:hypothetical protein
MKALGGKRREKQIEVRFGHIPLHNTLSITAL